VAHPLRGDLVLAIDLLSVAVSAGHSLHGALAVVAEQPRGPVTAALAAAHRAVGRGVPIEQALAEVVRAVGDDGRPLVSTLQLGLASGAALGPSLERLADAERRRNRRLAEVRVRRLPVLLLGPVVGLVLPAFVVLTLVPVALGPGMSGLMPLIGAFTPPLIDLHRSTPWTAN
jgi:pilus assembly protein TadC